jgi:hypothetical protein
VLPIAPNESLVKISVVLRRFCAVFRWLKVQPREAESVSENESFFVCISSMYPHVCRSILTVPVVGNVNAPLFGLSSVA